MMWALLFLSVSFALLDEIPVLHLLSKHLPMADQARLRQTNRLLQMELPFEPDLNEVAL